MSDGAATSARTSDLAVFAASRSSERHRFEERIRPLMPDLLAYFVRRISPREDAADCLSEVLTVLWRRRRDLPEDDVRMRAWSYGIAKGVLANAVRGKVRRAALTDRVFGETVEAVADPTEGDLDVRRALDQLPKQDQELVRLVIWDGFGVAEAGALLGLRPEAARSRYSRARARLKATLG